MKNGTTQTGQIAFINYAQSESSSSTERNDEQFTTESLKQLAFIVSLTSGSDTGGLVGKQSSMDMLIRNSLDSHSKILFMINYEPISNEEESARAERKAVLYDREKKEKELA